jgi:hypothetical protein
LAEEFARGMLIRQPDKRIFLVVLTLWNFEALILGIFLCANGQVFAIDEHHPGAVIGSAVTSRSNHQPSLA